MLAEPLLPHWQFRHGRGVCKNKDEILKNYVGYFLPDWVRASVEMSGTGMAGWSVGSERAVRAGLELASKVLEKEGMHTDSSHVMDLKKSILLKQRLKTMSIDEIMQIVREMVGWCRKRPKSPSSQLASSF